MASESPFRMMQPDRQRVRRRAAPRRRGRNFLLLTLLVVVLAAGWCGAWYYAASVADSTLAGWVEREAAAGRVYNCGSQDITGFPFRIQAHCAEASAALKTVQPPFTVAANEVTFTAQVYHPTLLVGEVTSPVTVQAPGDASPSFVATWSLGRLSVSGFPPNPDSVAVDIDQLHLDHGAGANAVTWFAADNTQLNARIVAGAANNNPIIDVVLHFTSAIAPTLHRVTADPLQGDIEVVIRGLKDLSPKPLAERFHEMQANGGNIEIKALRLERTDAVVVGAGTITVNDHGRLDGAVNVAIAGIENIVPLLGLDQLIGQGIDRMTGANGQPGQGLAALDRLVPGLSGVVRQGATTSVIDNLKKMGQPTEIDKKPATILPLRFSDGSVYLAMIRVGSIPPLF
ncbi:MAG: DUF2125 domain-containing protein [Xanthobacteraceae bacterium]